MLRVVNFLVVAVAGSGLVFSAASAAAEDGAPASTAAKEPLGAALPSAAPSSDSSPSPQPSPTRGEGESAGASSPSASSPAAASPNAAARAEAKPAAPRSLRVLFIITADCPRCDEELAKLRRPGGDFEKLQSAGWKIGPGPESHLQIVDRAAVAELADQLGARDYPVVACISNNRIERSFTSGCTTPLDMWTFGWLLNGKDQRPAGSIPEKATVDWTGNYPLRGNHWSIDGDWTPSRTSLISHLRGPVHGPQIAGRYTVESWSYEELRSLHDHLHEVEMGGVTFGGYGMSGQSNASSNMFNAARKASGR